MQFFFLFKVALNTLFHFFSFLFFTFFLFNAEGGQDVIVKFKNIQQRIFFTWVRRIMHVVFFFLLWWRRSGCHYDVLTECSLGDAFCT